MRNLMVFVLFFALTACAGGAQNRQTVEEPVRSRPVETQNLPERAGPSPSVTVLEQPISASPHPPLESAVPVGTPSPAAYAGLVLKAPGAFPDPASYQWVSLATGLRSPVGIAHAGDGSGRLFILEQPGRILIFTGNAVLPQPFLDIQDRVGSQGNEQGLLGLAFHPRYSENGYFYVNYTDLQGDTVIARFNVSPLNPDQADTGSEFQLLSIPQPYANHNGGGMAFGPDGYLYLGLGDGGSGGDPQGNAQSLDTLLGKILRLDVDRQQPYGIPADNPFSKSGGCKEIWAYGLRNPWRFSFDRLAGGLYIGDVGQNAWEEIDYLPVGSPGGANFGWDYMEGSHPYEGIPPAGSELISPILEYGHDQGCSVTGGNVYRGSALPEWGGIYLYGDFCSGNVWGAFQAGDSSWQHALLFQNVGRITSFGEDEQGELYLSDRSGALMKLVKR